MPADCPREPAATALLLTAPGDALLRYYEMRRRVRRRWPRVCACGTTFTGRFVRCARCRAARRAGKGGRR